jgi:hypothetical protein
LGSQKAGQAAAAAAHAQCGGDSVAGARSTKEDNWFSKGLILVNKLQAVMKLTKGQMYFKQESTY